MPRSPTPTCPTSVRESGIPVRARRRASDLDGGRSSTLAGTRTPRGPACVIGDPAVRRRDARRVRSLTPELAKGLEFDLVVLVDPDGFGDGIEGAVDRYVAMTRATQRLVVLTT